jgi:hypothetical protein
MSEMVAAQRSIVKEQYTRLLALELLRRMRLSMETVRFLRNKRERLTISVALFHFACALRVSRLPASQILKIPDCTDQSAVDTWLIGATLNQSVDYMCQLLTRVMLSKPHIWYGLNSI